MTFSSRWREMLYMGFCASSHKTYEIHSTVLFVLFSNTRTRRHARTIDTPNTKLVHASLRVIKPFEMCLNFVCATHNVQMESQTGPEEEGSQRDGSSHLNKGPCRQEVAARTPNVHSSKSDSQVPDVAHAVPSSAAAASRRMPPAALPVPASATSSNATDDSSAAPEELPASPRKVPQYCCVGFMLLVALLFYLSPLPVLNLSPLPVLQNLFFQFPYFF